MSRQRKMILGAVARGIGSHVAAWRHPSVPREKLKAATTLRHWAELAKIVEAGKMHFVFLADLLAMPSAGDAPLLRRSAYDFSLEPMTLLYRLSPLPMLAVLAVLVGVLARRVCGVWCSAPVACC